MNPQHQAEVTYAFDPLDGRLRPSAVKNIEKYVADNGYEIVGHATWFDMRWGGDPVEGAWMVTYFLNPLKDTKL